MIRVYNKDALELLRGLPAESVHLFLTDPPYESLEKHRSHGTTTRLSQSKRSSNEWFDIFPNYALPEMFHHMYRALAPSSHSYVFCDDETSDLMRTAATAAGFKVWKRLVWDKESFGMGYHYRCQYEFVLFLEKKPQRKLNSLSIPDVLRFKRPNEKWVNYPNGYPAEKPVALCQVLVGQSTDHGEIVCDPFCGSGASGVAALRAGCGYIGSDTKQEAVALTTRRLARERPWASKKQ